MIRFVIRIVPLAVLMLSGSLGSAQPASEVAWETLPDALAAGASHAQPVLVYVQAAWCGPCRRLENETFSDGTVARVLHRFARARLTFDDGDRVQRVGPYRLSEAEWAERLGAESTPTLVLLAADGSLLGRHSGFLPPDGLLPVLEAALAETEADHDSIADSR